MTPQVFTLLALVPGQSGNPDWVALVQQPFERMQIDAPRLPRLLPAGESIASLDDWKRARGRLVQTWIRILGESPERPARLDVTVELEEHPPGFRRKVLQFSAEGNDRIRAALLLPEDLQPGQRIPAVVVFHETTPLTFRQSAGLAGDPDRHFGVELVRRGYAVLCPESFILKQPEGAAGQPINVAKMQAAALHQRRPEWSGMGKLTFDATRCVDFLESIPQVDKQRIGCLGHSLGAKEVLYAMAFEPRYRAGVANEGGVGIRMSNWADEWYLGRSINERVAMVDHHQLLALAAPRALLIEGGGSADGEKSWPFVAAALPVYRLLSAPDRIGLYDHGGKHSFPLASREMAYRWLDHWLDVRPRSPVK